MQRTINVLMDSVQLLNLRQIRMMEYLVNWVFAIRPCNQQCQDARKTIFPFRSDMLFTCFIACFITCFITDITCYITGLHNVLCNMQYNLLCNICT
jgi:hypothetical protein